MAPGEARESGGLNPRSTPSCSPGHQGSQGSWQQGMGERDPGLPLWPHLSSESWVRDLSSETTTVPVSPCGRANLREAISAPVTLDVAVASWLHFIKASVRLNQTF